MDVRRLLLVEDRLKDELLILRGLQRAGLDWPVSVARDGAQALELLFGAAASPRPPGLILLDVKLPRVGGLQVLERVRSEPRTRCVPVVMLSSSDDQRDVHESCRLGANAYIRKTSSIDRLNDALGALVAFWTRYHEPAEPTAESGGA